MKITSQAGIPAKYEIKYRSNMDWDQFKALEDKKRAGLVGGKKSTKKKTPSKKKPIKLKSSAIKIKRNSWNQPPDKPRNALVMKLLDTFTLSIYQERQV